MKDLLTHIEDQLALKRLVDTFSNLADVKDSWMQHLTYRKDVREGASNEWLEPATDNIYNKLK